MGGHHEPELPVVPNAKIYRIQDVPQLMTVQKALATHNLSDPWARNHVWKFLIQNNPKMTPSIFKVLSLGFKKGLILAILSVAAERAYKIYDADPGEHH